MKRTLKTIDCTLLFIFLFIKISGQSTFSVGSTVREFAFSHLINYPSSTAKIKSFNKKLIILDFWAKSCSGCILYWPKILQLQNQFRDSVQIILMDPWDSEADVRAVIDKRKKLANVNMNLPGSCGDKKLLQLLPITTIPFIVIIKDDTVRYIANGEILKPSCISAILKGNFILSGNETFIDNTERIRIDPVLPFFGQANVENARHEGISINDVISQSTLTRGNDSLWMGQYIRIKDDRGFITCINSSVAELYRLAYSERVDPMAGGDDEAMLMKSSIIWEATDSAFYQGSVDNSIQYQNLYNYQLISRFKTVPELRRIMREDIGKYFGLDVHWEKRKRKCLVLSAEDTMLISYRTGGWKRLMSISMVNMNKIPIIYFIRGLEDLISYYYDSPYAIIDETGLKGNLGSFSLEADFNDPASLDKALQKYKMHFTLEEREVRVLIIRDPSACFPRIDSVH
jgi:thiol-disulfide isomerase/thioredoxin